MERPSLGQKIEVEITGYTAEGKGVCRILSYPIFVPFSAKGDKLVIKIVKDRKSFFEAEIVEVLVSSKDRTKPDCVYFENCGGCDILHIDYENQKLLKRQTVDNAIIKIAKNNGIITNDVIGMDTPKNYRNKAIFNYEARNGKIISGFFRKKSNEVVEIDECNIVHSKINEIKTIVDEFCNEINFLPKRLLVKHSFSTDESMVCLVIDKKRFKYNQLFIEKLEKLENIKSIIINYANEKTVVLGEKSDVIFGREYINENIDNIVFKNYLHSFFQVNPEQTKKLYSKGVSLLDLTATDIVLDIYCGVGTLSLLCAKKAKKVIGIEIVEQAILSANDNAIYNKIENTTFIKGDAQDLLEFIEVDNLKNIKVIVDPPRKGLDKKVIHSILSIKPSCIVYISCNEGTMARDLRIFNENGYFSGEATPVDMFCGSHHIESVLRLEKL